MKKYPRGIILGAQRRSKLQRPLHFTYLAFIRPCICNSCILILAVVFVFQFAFPFVGHLVKSCSFIEISSIIFVYLISCFTILFIYGVTYFLQSCHITCLTDCLVFGLTVFCNISKPKVSKNISFYLCFVSFLARNIWFHILVRISH